MLSVFFMRSQNIDRLATKAMFFGAGFITAAWAAIIPFVKTNIHISDGTIGLGAEMYGLPGALYLIVGLILFATLLSKKIKV